MKKGLIGALSAMAGAAAGIGAAGRLMGKTAEEKQLMSDKHLALFLMMNEWVKVKQEGKNLASYFEKNGYKKIAVYGMSYAGETLVNELKGSSIEVKYGIDKNAGRLYAEMDIVTPDEPLEDVDAVVVTPVFFFEEIEEALSAKLDCPIISLEDILYEV